MSATANNAPSRNPGLDPARAWRRAGLLFFLATALLFGLFHETMGAMVKTWMTSDTFGYGFLILPIVVFLTYQRRRQLAVLIPQTWFWALLWIGGALLVYLVGTVGNALILKQLAFVALWQGIFALLTGWQVVQRMLFPIFFLIFAVPMGEEIVPFLQKITAEIAVTLLRASGVPTFHSGVLIEIPTGSFVVADVCSGVRFLITTLVLGTLAANLFFSSWRRRILFMLICLIVPILANGLRAYGIVMLAHLTDHALAISVDHILYGFIFLSLVLLILTGLGAIFRDRWPTDQNVEIPTPVTAFRLSSSLFAFLLVALLLGGGKVWSLQVSSPPAVGSDFALSDIGPGEGWSPTDLTLAGWEPAFPGADLRLLRTYQAPDGDVAFFVAHYGYQRDGHEIIAPGNSFTGRGVERLVTRFEEIEIRIGERTFAVQESVVQLEQGAHLVWSWYDIGGTRTTSPVVGKILEIWHALSGGSRAATAFALLTETGPDLPSDRARLATFLDGLEESRGLATAVVQPDR